MTSKTNFTTRVWDEALEMFRERQVREVFDPLTGAVRSLEEEAPTSVATARLEEETRPGETSSRCFSALEEQLEAPPETLDAVLEEEEEHEVVEDLHGFDFEDDLSEDVEEDADDLFWLEDAFFLEEEEEFEAEEDVVLGAGDFARGVQTQGKQERERKLRRFLDERLVAWMLGRSGLDRFVTLMWGSDNWTSTFDALERAFERGLTLDDLEWAYDVRLQCEDRLGYKPCWKWLFDMREHLDAMVEAEEAVRFLELARDAFVEDRPRMHGWYHFELAPLDREESNGKFYLYLRALLEQMPSTCDPLHALETLLTLERQDQHTVFEHHTRRDHCALDANATYFHRLF